MVCVCFFARSVVTLSDVVSQLHSTYKDRNAPFLSKKIIFNYLHKNGVFFPPAVLSHLPFHDTVITVNNYLRESHHSKNCNILY